MSTTESTPTSTSTDKPTIREAIISADTLYQFLKSVGAVDQEVESYIDFNDDHILARATNYNNVTTGKTRLSTDAFEHYELPEHTIGINPQKLLTFLQFSEPSDLILLRFNPNTDEITIAYDYFKINTRPIDPMTIREFYFPDVDYTTEFSIPLQSFSKACKASDQVSDHIGIDTDADNETVTLGSTDGDNSTALTLDDEVTNFSGDEDTNSTFALQYIQRFLSGIPDHNDINIHYGAEIPLHISFEFADGSGTGEYLIAPRIQDDND